MGLLRTLNTAMGIVIGSRPNAAKQVPFPHRLSCMCCGATDNLVEYEGESFCSLHRPSCMCCGATDNLVEYEGESFCLLHVPEVPGKPRKAENL